ncbi:cytochrome P450 [Suillus subluteus]|nr:cytochrome P450 [Suillus subluteus]
MLFTHILAVGIPCIIALVVASGLTRRRVYPFPLPPGPCSLPLLGNALQLDTKRLWLTYTAWGKTYGKMIYCRILGIDLIIINSETIARELLDKHRSANYSTRPVIRTNELSGLDFNTGLLPYGETLRQHRKIFHQVLRVEVSVSYHEMHSRHANELLTINPCDRYTASLVMAVTYGHLAHEDIFLTRVNELIDITKYILAPERAAMFTAFPFRDQKLPFWCFPGGFALMGRCRELCQQLLNEPFGEVKAQMANGTASHSLITNFLSQARDDADDDTMKAVALMGFMAGLDTTTSALQTFLLAMVLYPDVQAQARAEIDQVVRHDKMPCLDDRASLPYLDAVLHEVLRWYPPVPPGVPHATSNDDIYDRCFIPKGAIVMVNQWALSRDEDMFPDASRFDPSRHLTVEGKLKDPFVNHFAFGRWFAENSLWTAAAAILAVLRIDHAKDSNGDRIEVKPEFSTGMTIHPEPFQCWFESVNIVREGHLREMTGFEVGFICTCDGLSYNSTIVCTTGAEYTGGQGFAGPCLCL